MRITPRLPDGFLDEPYSAEPEPLSKADLSQRLTTLYSKLDHGTVAILQGRWGSGKSTFARKWLRTLDADGFGTIYFDAFENDYIPDPFVALNATLLRKFDSQPDKGGEGGVALKRAAVAVSKKLLIASAKVGVKAATLGALNLADLDVSEELSGSASDSLGDAAESAVQSILESHAKADAAFASFRQSLAKVPASLSSPDGRGAGRAVFVIDELDRCRPDFALGLIECLKHFFNTDKLHFVLVANKDFLVSSVHATYGLSDAAEEYLDKFFDFSIMFEEGVQYSNSAPNVFYAKRIVSQLIDDRTRDANELEDTIAEIAGAFDLTYRQIEKIATNAALAYGAFADREYRPAFMVAFLCFLKAIHPKVYESIKLRRFRYKPFEAIIRKGTWNEYSTIERVLTIFEYHSNDEIDENADRFQGYAGSFNRFAFRDRKEILPYVANSVVDRFSR